MAEAARAAEGLAEGVPVEDSAEKDSAAGPVAG